MILPTAKEINPFNDLDGSNAEKHFLGKTLDEAGALFRENSLYYQEDLMFMGPVAFRFYVQAAIDYIRSDASEGDLDLISCFAGILEYRLEHEADGLKPIAELLGEACEYILNHLHRFGAEEGFDRKARGRVERLRERFVSMGCWIDRQQTEF